MLIVEVMQMDAELIHCPIQLEAIYRIVMQDYRPIAHSRGRLEQLLCRQLGYLADNALLLYQDNSKCSDFGCHC